MPSALPYRKLSAKTDSPHATLRNIVCTDISRTYQHIS
jgi:hypothetical protein